MVYYFVVEILVSSTEDEATELYKIKPKERG